jgi:hypothetical protein
MRSAKIQKATMDPLKISGRCGRLMCCLRYEDQTYDELAKRLPKPKSRVGTTEGPGLVIDAKILVQLVLVRLEHDGREIAVPVEELVDPENCPVPAAAPAPDPLRGLSPAEVRRRAERGPQGGKPPMRPAPPASGGQSKAERQDAFREQAQRVEREGRDRPKDAPPARPEQAAPPAEPNAASPDAPRKKKKRRRGRRRRPPGSGSGPGPDQVPPT